MNAAYRPAADSTFRRSLPASQPAGNRAAEFVAIVAHELRNPLAPLRSVAALLRTSGMDAPAISLAARIIDRQVSTLNHLIDDLLHAPRMASGKFPLLLAPTVLTDVIERALETARPIVAERGHSLLVSVPSQRITLEADAMRMSQVLHNLIVNAAKYSDPGGSVRLDVRRDGTDAVITVSDTGIGIDRAHLESIFDLYAQGATGRAAGGLGIGLYVARSLVEGHGGTLLAVSEGAGRGSQFIVRLPGGYAPANEQTASDAAKAHAWEDEGGSVLSR